MLLLVACWGSLAIVFYTIGDAIVLLYNSLCRTNERYNFVSVVILGMCTLLIPLGFSSIVIPSNHWILLFLICGSILYWIRRRRYLKKLLSSFKKRLQSITLTQWSFLCIIILCIVSNSLLSSNINDAIYYHYQNIRWNEEFSAIPGLANLESRFGFNSNYLLLSAIFSYRFIGGEAVFLIQSFLLVIIIIWFTLNIFQHKRKIIFLIASCLLLLLYNTNLREFNDSSTDIVPALVTFYFLVYYISNPHMLERHKLFVVFIPVAMISFKLSTAPLSIISLYIIYQCFIKKQYRNISFLLAICFLIITPWLIRNVIISGYLIYPLYWIDLFNVDWKVPKFIAEIESDVIIGYAKIVFNDIVHLDEYRSMTTNKMRLMLLSDGLVILVFFYAICSIIFSTYKLFIKPNKIYFILFFSMLISVVYWLIFAPDYRFASGIILGITFLGFKLLVGDAVLKRKSYTIIRNVLLLTWIISLSFMTLRRYNSFLHDIENYEQYRLEARGIRSLLLHPYSSEAMLSKKTTYTPYKLNNLTIYMTNSPTQKTYSMLPATCYARKTPNAKNLPIEAIEARGSTLHQGFRPKDDADKGWWNKPFDWETFKKMRGGRR